MNNSSEKDIIRQQFDKQTKPIPKPIMQFFVLSALASMAAATNYYGGARLATTGLTSGYSTGYTGLNSGYTGLNAGYNGFNTFNTVAVPVRQVAVVAKPAYTIQKVATSGLTNGIATTGFVGGYTYGQAAVAPLAVQTSHQIQYQDVPSGGQINPISVDIDANPIPINMVFRSASSQLNVQQAHQGAAGSVQESASEDETHVLRHTVTKPVLQEVKEVITPFRRIEQTIQPVREEINTVVARGVNQGFSNQAFVNQGFVNQVAAPVQTVQAVQTVAAPAYEKVYTPVAATQVVSTPITTQVVAAPAYEKVYTSNQFLAARPVAATQFVGATVQKSYAKEY